MKVENMVQIKRFILEAVLKMGVGITSARELRRLQSIPESQYLYDLRFFANFPPEIAEKMLKHYSNSKSQLRQDLFVLGELNFKQNGYFVEFGATDGKNLSNTYLLEKYFSWQGILAEPARIYSNAIELNRPSSQVDRRCVWSTSGEELEFNETRMPELSTLEVAKPKDEHFAARIDGNKYKVITISLEDLLKSHDAPSYIDYLSIDTEGSEFDILNAFDFKSYSFGVITCEHNYTPARW
jgi:FkbM family methyltransferase